MKQFIHLIHNINITLKEVSFLLHEFKDNNLSFKKNNTELYLFKRDILIKEIKSNQKNIYVTDFTLYQKDPVFMSFIISKDRLLFNTIPKYLSYNKNFILQLLNITPDLNIFNLLPQHLKNNKELIKSFIIYNPHILSIINNNIKNDRDFIYKLSKITSIYIQYLPLTLRDDKELIKSIFLNQINNHRLFNSLQYVSLNLQNDLDIVYLAIKHNPNNISFIGDNIKSQISSTKNLSEQIKNLILIRDTNLEKKQLNNTISNVTYINTKNKLKI